MLLVGPEDQLTMLKLFHLINLPPKFHVGRETLEPWSHCPKKLFEAMDLELQHLGYDRYGHGQPGSSCRIDVFIPLTAGIA